VAVPLAAAAAHLGEAVSALAAAAAALRPVGPWGGALVAVAGIAGLTMGARHPRVLGVWGGAVAGGLAAAALHGPIQAYLGVSPSLVAWAGGVAGAAVCGIFPGAFPLVAGALPAGVLGVQVPLAGQPAFGAAAGALAGAIAGVSAARLVTAAFASFVAGAVAVLGASTALVSQPLAREIAARPFALAGLTLVLGIAGTAFQASRPAARAQRANRPEGAAERLPPGERG
jgi:hypothetical protein